MPQPRRKAPAKKAADAPKRRPSRAKPKSPPVVGDGDAAKTPRQRTAAENAAQPAAVAKVVTAAGTLPEQVKEEMRQGYASDAAAARERSEHDLAASYDAMARSLALDGIGPVAHAIASAQVHATLHLASETRRLTLALTRERDIFAD